ncbi:MAG: sorbitol dehydrogenase [Nitrospinota bacterium]|nr:MAG: sorbitol dehydrogenase [Nitrospinota bacterium]
MAKTGRAALLDKIEGTFTIEEAVVPDPGPGEVLVRQELCGVCGTDAHVYRGHMPRLRFPLVMGHEPVGIIEKLGAGVTTDFSGRPIKEGDRIYIVPGLRCGQCYFCAVLKEPCLCRHGTGYGFRPLPDHPPHFQGGFAEYIHLNHPQSRFFQINADPRRAVLLEPFTIGLHQVDRVRLRPGQTVVIQGAGAIGLCTLMAAKLAGGHKAIVIGAPASRLALAKELGADVTINIEEIPDPKERIALARAETTGRYGADAVFECTGFPQAIPEGLEMLRRGGTYCVAGHFTDVGEVALNPFRHLNHKHITLVGVWASEVGHFQQGREIMEGGHLPFERLVSHQLPLERIGDAINAIGQSYRLDGEEIRKVVIAAGA